MFLSFLTKKMNPRKDLLCIFDIEGPKSTTLNTARPRKLLLLLLSSKKALFSTIQNDSFFAFKENYRRPDSLQSRSSCLAAVTWKFDTPANGVRRLMPNEVGYEAMLTAVKGKKGECVVFVYMPPSEERYGMRSSIGCI